MDLDLEMDLGMEDGMEDGFGASHPPSPACCATLGFSAAAASAQIAAFQSKPCLEDYSLHPQIGKVPTQMLIDR
jgi:hypothetical protein